MRVARSAPYLRALYQSPVNKRRTLLQSFPRFVADDMVEILYNIVFENAAIPSIRRKRLNMAQRRIVERLIARARNRAERRKLIYKQTGGFLSAILPILASVVGSIVGNAA